MSARTLEGRIDHALARLQFIEAACVSNIDPAGRVINVTQFLEGIAAVLQDVIEDIQPLQLAPFPISEWAAGQSLEQWQQKYQDPTP